MNNQDDMELRIAVIKVRRGGGSRGWVECSVLDSFPLYDEDNIHEQCFRGLVDEMITEARKEDIK